MSKFICDFCCSKEPADKVAWSYPCENFSMGARDGREVHASFGNWAACNTCHDLIEANDYEELLNRSTLMFFRNEGDIIPKKLIKQSISVVHTNFREHRSGVASKFKNDAN